MPERDTSEDTVDNRAALEEALKMRRAIPELVEDPPTGMAALMAWLTEDYECNGADIAMNCSGADYEDDDTPEGQHEVRWNYVYEITLHEVGMYGSAPASSTGDESWTIYKHIGHGSTMDEAADNALAVMREHYELIVKPMIVIPAGDAQVPTA